MSCTPPRSATPTWVRASATFWTVRTCCPAGKMVSIISLVAAVGTSAGDLAMGDLSAPAVTTILCQMERAGVLIVPKEVAIDFTLLIQE